MKIKYLAYLLTVVMMWITIDDIQAQRRGSKRRSTRRARVQEPTEPLATQWYAIHMGNLNFGTQINLATKFTYGFEFKKRFSIGASAKGQFEYINFQSPTPDISLFTYGGALITRIKIAGGIFAAGEYGYTSFGSVTNGFDKIREGHWYPAVGGGYKSGIGDWTYGLHVLFPLKDRVRDFVGADYWIDFNYKF